MKHRIAFCQRALASLLTAALILPLLGAPASGTAAENGLYRGQTPLVNDDTVVAGELLTWKSSVTLTDGTGTCTLPASLKTAGGTAVLTAGGNPVEIPISAGAQSFPVTLPESTFAALSGFHAAPPAEETAPPAESDAQSAESGVQSAESDAQSAESGVQSASLDQYDPEAVFSFFQWFPRALAAGETYDIAVPCHIDANTAVDGMLTIDGLTLRLGSGLESPTLGLYDADAYEGGALVPLDGKEIGLRDTFLLGYLWNDLKAAAPDMTYALDLPDKIGAPEDSGSMPCTAQVSTSAGPVTITFGELAWTAGSSRMTVTFCDTGNPDVPLQKLRNVGVFFSCSLADDGLAPDADGRVTIELPGSGEVTIIVSDFKPTGPKLEKAVSELSADGTAAWTVTYTPESKYFNKNGDKDAQIPALIRDTLPEGLEYVAGTFRVNGSPAEPAWDGQTWTYTLPAKAPDAEDPPQPIVLTFDTRIADALAVRLWTESGEVRIRNDVSALLADESPVSGLSANATLLIPRDWPGRKLLLKDAEMHTDDAGNRYLDWSLTVQTAGRRFTNLQIVDTMGKGLTLQDDSVKCKADGGAEQALTKNESGAPVVGQFQTETAADGKTKMTITLLHTDDPGANAAGTYLIHYRTQVNPDYFDHTPGQELGDADVSNSATLVWEWPSGSGVVPPMPPTVTKTPGDITGFDNDLIQKSAVSFNAATRALIWKITVNPHSVKLNSATVTDDLAASDPAHRFDPAQAGTLQAAITEKLPAGGGISDFSLTETALSFKVSNITKAFDFFVTTYASDPAVWANNAYATFKNLVVLSDITVNNQTISGSQTDSDAQAYTSAVLAKRPLAYDPAKNRVQWELTVNQNKTDLGRVEITDTLADGISCGADTAEPTLSSGSFDGTDNRFSVEGRTVHITLSNVTQTVTIRFWADVDVNAIGAFRTDPLVSLQNSASMDSTHYRGVTVGTKLDLENTVLDKSVVTQSGIKVQYSVKLNPLGIKLLAPGHARLELTDKLANGLCLDPDSIRLYPASARAAVGYDGKTAVTLQKDGDALQNIAVSYSAQNNEFTIGLPQDETPYILEYQAFAVRAGVALSNNVQLSGSSIPSESGQQLATSNFTLHAFALANIDELLGTFRVVQINKLDESGQPLTGDRVKNTGFRLYLSANDGEYFAEGVCDQSTGACVISIPLSQWPASVQEGGIIYVQETDPPSGYEASPGRIPVQVTAANPLIAAVRNYPTGSGETSSAKLQVKKIAKDSDPEKTLAGAKFGLYTDLACANPVLGADGQPLTATTGSDGLALFEGLYPGAGYYLKELAAPAGYALLSAPILAAAGGVDGVAAVCTVANTVQSSGGHHSGGGRPANPVGPLDPADPTDPENPLDPGQPADPDPNDPVKPNEPNHPNSGGTGGGSGESGTTDANIPDGSRPGGGAASDSQNSGSSIPKTGVTDRVPLWTFGMLLSLALAGALCIAQFHSQHGKHVKRK